MRQSLHCLFDEFEEGWLHLLKCLLIKKPENEFARIYPYKSGYLLIHLSQNYIYYTSPYNIYYIFIHVTQWLKSKIQPIHFDLYAYMHIFILWGIYLFILIVFTQNYCKSFFVGSNQKTHILAVLRK